MRAVVQRVARATVSVDGTVVGRVGAGLCVLVGAAEDDTDDDVETLARKIAELRIFEDDDGRMNRSVEEIGGAVLLVSQFTLLGDCRKGRRPSFAHAMRPERAEPMVDRLATALKARRIEVATGRFGAMMDVDLVNRGPVTILLDTKKTF